jgi:hypothetical protein
MTTARPAALRIRRNISKKIDSRSTTARADRIRWTLGSANQGRSTRRESRGQTGIANASERNRPRKFRRAVRWHKGHHGLPIQIRLEHDRLARIQTLK